MIQFKCQCGHEFNEPEDHAGLELQCPTCLRLVDVPRLSELAGITAEGTYVLTDPAPTPQNSAPDFDDVMHAFHRSTVDEHGVEKDLRLNNDRLSNVGRVPFEDHINSVVQPPPKYDPETGELLTPMDITPQVVTPIPIIDPNTARTLKYAPPSKQEQNVSYWRVWGELLKVQNLAVMAFPFFTILILSFVYGLFAGAMIFPIGLSIMAGLALFSHYGSVPREMGYNERDDLPRPLGDLDWLEDIFNPLGCLILAALLCYWPGVMVEQHRTSLPNPWFAGLVVGLVGDFFFPAVLLTITNSGSLFNLRPDRVFKVIQVTGWFYLVLVAEWVIAMPLYVAAAGFMNVVAYGVIYRHLPKWSLPIAMTALAGGVYFLYVFLWQLGLVYRKKREHFSWVLQHYLKPAR